MGKRIKKGTRGDAAAFVTRTQALKKLQLTLREFRRLCILKGIFPKEPKKKFKGVNKTYYYMKDIKYLAHEKLLRKFRNIQTYEKKIKKAKAKQMKFDAKKLEENKPTYSLNHIIKERYPRFVDAIGDLDDAISLICLFANAPKHELLKIDTDVVALCKRLYKEFYLYISSAQILRKAFISIKGMYVNVEIMGEVVTWLHPFAYPQKLTFEIDYEIMLSFLELYTNLMKFVNFKLYKDIGLAYPPPLENIDFDNFGFNSLEIRDIQEDLRKNKRNSAEHIANELNCDSHELKSIMQKEEEIAELNGIFSKCCFFISREVPKNVIGMFISSCGGIYGDESELTAYNEDDPRITHFVVDRPKEFISFKANREYVQPQWVVDCINSKKLIPTADYAPGKKLPPHLSPFFDRVGEEYKTSLPIKTKKKPTENSEQKQEQEPEHEDKENTELREMMLSNKKKKLLQKVREEKAKAKRIPKKIKSKK